MTSPLWKDWRGTPDWGFTEQDTITLEVVAEKVNPPRFRSGMERELLDLADRRYHWVNPHDWERYGRLHAYPKLTYSNHSVPIARLGPDIRRLGGRIVGARGSGKTIYLAFQTMCDFFHGVGSIVIDPMGALTNYLLSRMAPFIDAGEHWFTWDHITYVPVGGMQIAGEDYVIPTPFFFNSGNDSLYDQTNRVVDLWKRLNPEQESAPVQGMPSIERTANHLGMLLVAMGKQLVPDASFMLDSPERWVSAARSAALQYPFELASPLQTLELYADPKFPRTTERNETLSFLNKIGPSVLSPRLAAQFGATEWGVDLSSVDVGKLIIFDCSAITSRAEKRATLTWLFGCCMEYFRSRGPRRDVVGFVLDELSYLINEQNTLLEEDFEDLIARIGRNFGVSSSISYQSVLQPSEGMRTNLDMLGYSLLGPAINEEAADAMARMIDPYDPLWVKSEEPVYDTFDSEVEVRPYTYETRRQINHYRTAYYAPDEQQRMNAERHLKTKSGEFYLFAVGEEGGAPSCAYRVGLERILAIQPFDETVAEAKKAELVKRDGRKVTEVLAEIAARQPPPLQPPPSAASRSRPKSPPPMPLFAHPPTPRKGPPPKVSRD